MGIALVDTATGKVLSWQRHGELTAAVGQLVLDVAELPDARDRLRWNGSTGLRPMTAPELAQERNERRQRRRDVIAAMLAAANDDDDDDLIWIALRGFAKRLDALERRPTGARPGG